LQASKLLGDKAEIAFPSADLGLTVKHRLDPISGKQGQEVSIRETALPAWLSRTKKFNLNQA